MVKPAKKKQIVEYMVEEHHLSIKQACRSVNLQRSSYYYKSVSNTDSLLINSLSDLSHAHPGYGFKKMYHSLRNQGYMWNHKKVYRVYKELGLNLQRKRKRRLPCRERKNLEVPSEVNTVWSMDFMSDSLFSGRKFRTFNVIDDYNREALWIEIGLSIGAKHVTELLQWMIKERGTPRAIRVDNGPEFTSNVFMNWCFNHRIEILYIQPGKPVQNAFIERFNRTYRTEILDARIFRSLVEVRQLTYLWIEHYNQNRPHESLLNLSPLRYLSKKESSFDNSHKTEVAIS